MSYILSFVVLLAPFFSNYSLFGPISIGDFLVFLAVIFLAKKLKVTIFNLLIFLLYFGIVYIALYVLYDHGIDPGFFRMSFYGAAFLLATSLRNIDFERFLSAYVWLSIFFSASLICQWVIYQFLNISIPLQLPLPYYEADTLVILEDIYRSGGWYKEPSYFAIFITPVLFYLASEKSYYKFILIAIAGIMSTSSLAIFVILFSLILSFITTRRGWVQLAFFLPLFVPAVFYVLSSFGDVLFISRVLDIFVNGGTLIERVGPVFNIILLSTDLFPNRIAQQLVTSGGDTGTVWYNSLAYMLASLGWLGVLFMVLNFFRLGLVVGVVIFLLVVTAHFFSGPYSFFIAITFFAVNRRQKRGGEVEKLPSVYTEADLSTAK